MQILTVAVFAGVLTLGALVSCRRPPADLSMAAVGRSEARSSLPSAPVGGLVYAPLAAPISTLWLNNGEELLVVDPGGLTIRDPMTLELKHRIVPEVNYWSAATLKGNTVHGKPQPYPTSRQSVPEIGRLAGGWGAME